MAVAAVSAFSAVANLLAEKFSNVLVNRIDFDHAKCVLDSWKESTNGGLVWAVVRNQKALVELFLGIPGIDINAIHYEADDWMHDGSYTPLLYAVKFGSMDCAQSLLSDSRVDPNKGSPLIYAVKKCQFGSFSICQIVNLSACELVSL